MSPTREVSTIDFKNDPYLNEIRASWDSGIVPIACNACTSKPNRMDGSNAWYQNNNLSNSAVELTRIDYWTGDQCNLACAICGPNYSSAWKQELKLPPNKAVINKIWATINLQHIKQIHFNGGEPLLSKEHVKLLHSIPNKSKVQLNYNTNGTILPSVELQNLWAEFHLVTIDFSIDDVDDRFEYQRYPAKWKHVAANLQWYINNAPVNCMFAVNTTVSILNQANIPELTNWLEKNFSTNRVTDPIEFRQQPATGVFAINGNRGHALQFLTNCDTRRGTNWQTTFPELI